jgi:hypothetical protein
MSSAIPWRPQDNRDGSNFRVAKLMYGLLDIGGQRSEWMKYT